MSTPSCSRTCTACMLGGCPRTAWTPAEATSMSLRLPRRRRKKPSAIGLRQIFPVQTKRTLFTIQEPAHCRPGKVKSNRIKSTHGRRRRVQSKRQLVNQSGQAAANDNRDDVPIPFQHSDERDRADREREQIERFADRKKSVHAKPDGEGQHDAD